MEGRNQFTFYRSFYEAVEKLPKARQLQMYISIARYGLDLIEPEGLNDLQEGQFRLIRPILRTAWRKAMAGSIGGKISRRGPAEKISKGEIEKEKEIEIETETEGEGFRRFWARYPVQVGEAAARAVWERVTEEHEEEMILSQLERWRGSKAWAREDGRFIPKPEKWLSECWFLNSPPQPAPVGALGELGQAELEAIQRLLKEDD